MVKETTLTSQHFGAWFCFVSGYHWRSTTSHTLLKNNGLPAHSWAQIGMGGLAEYPTLNDVIIQKTAIILLRLHEEIRSRPV